MALIIEDGSIVANADSYVTVAEIRSYANKRGFDVPVADATVEQLAILANDYLQSLNYIGDLVEKTQPLKWPRKNITDVEIDEIPTDIKNAQIELTIAANESELLTREQSAAVIKETIGNIATDYAGNGLTNLFSSQRVSRYLGKYLVSTSVLRV